MTLCRTAVRRFVVTCLSLLPLLARPEGLDADRLGVVYSTLDPSSIRTAHLYAEQRHVPPANIVGIAIPDRPSITRSELTAARDIVLRALPSAVQSLALVWSRPYAVECMSVTTAFAAGYQPGFCEPGCGRTLASPLYDADGWLPADTVGWLPAMLLPSGDEPLARALIERGVRADGTQPRAALYLVRTADASRNVRAAGYERDRAMLAGRIGVRDLTTPVGDVVDAAAGYFTGASRVIELPRIHFVPGAAADHLTSAGGVLDGSAQMTALEWLRQGATGSYGTVTEPCNHPGKFPEPGIFMKHYLRGETLLESYWKSVAMPGQGLFIGEPLARPYSPGKNDR